MLTRDHAIREFSGGKVHPDRLTVKRHPRYPALAAAMMRAYRTGAGRTRQELHQAIEKAFAEEDDCPPKRIRAFCKILDDYSEFDTAPKAWQTRREVLRHAAPMHPLARASGNVFQRDEKAAKQEIAAALARPWPEIERDYFADTPGQHRLRAFAGPKEPAALLSLYNLAQTQVALFDAERLTLELTSGYKAALRAIKFSRLVHDITRVAPGHYRVEIDGPVSVIRETSRYGASMARLLPVLVRLRGWKLCAVIKARGWRGRLALELSPETGLKAPPGAAPEFDSATEEKFFEKWGPEPRDGWTCHREGEILHRGQKVFFPDFIFRHADGRKASLEIIGFWTPEYLRAKRETLQHFAGERLALAVRDATKADFSDLGFPIFPYRETLQPKAVLAWLEKL